MVIVKIVGGLTSQMHKYALGRVLSLKYNVPLKLDLSWFSDATKTDTPWPYQLDLFAIKADVATGQEIRKLKGRTFLNRLIKKLNSIFGTSFKNKTYFSGSFVSVEDFFKLGGEVYIEGEWAGFDYFIGYESILKEDFKLGVVVDEEVLKQERQIQQDEHSVSLHVRRGDFVSHPGAAKFHAVCSPTYYYSAVSLIKENLKNINLYVFSDDIDWVKENLKFDDRVQYMNSNKNYEDILLMSACRHNIIANSGFSLWSAWLNNNQSKIVVMPKMWFYDEKLNDTVLRSFESLGYEKI